MTVDAGRRDEQFAAAAAPLSQRRRTVAFTSVSDCAHTSLGRTSSAPQNDRSYAYDRPSPPPPAALLVLFASVTAQASVVIDSTHRLPAERQGWSRSGWRARTTPRC
jgi:hypothetical protein